MTKTDEFFREDEWVEELYQEYLAKERECVWEHLEAPWRPAMREFLEKGCKIPPALTSADFKCCAIQQYCDGTEFRRNNGYSACAECPYGRMNMELFQELSEVLQSFLTT